MRCKGRLLEGYLQKGVIVQILPPNQGHAVVGFLVVVCFEFISIYPIFLIRRRSHYFFLYLFFVGLLFDGGYCSRVDFISLVSPLTSTMGG